MKRIAFFISPHGYGHAARSSAIMTAIVKRVPSVIIDVFTLVPESFFRCSVSGTLNYHRFESDVGVAQRTAMEADLDGTVTKLKNFLPFNEATIARTVQTLKQAQCELVICDVSPIGVAIAKSAEINSVLIENFTWDFIYEPYAQQDIRFVEYIQQLREIYASANFRVRTQPACDFRLEANFTSNVVYREAKTSRDEIRMKFRLDSDEKLILVSMGGILTDLQPLSKSWNKRSNSNLKLVFAAPAPVQSIVREGNVVAVPFDEYFPDIVNASDAVVAKLGYSTLAEAYASNVPFMFIPRLDFREAEATAAFAVEHGAKAISEQQFLSGEWLNSIPDLILDRRRVETRSNGADEIAAFIEKLPCFK
jgi:UDP:flavonoid glycosyltransferase YjiC (YdhE family)